jgi:NADH:ubiquinone oxidoreductase subunit 3 (subunit A)
MPAELLSNPVAIFLISLVVASLVYLLGRSKSVPHPDKAVPYACGESVAAEREPVSIHIFEFAAVFLVFDVIAIVGTLHSIPLTPCSQSHTLALAAVALYSLPVFRRRR